MMACRTDSCDEAIFFLAMATFLDRLESSRELAVVAFLTEGSEDFIDFTDFSGTSGAWVFILKTSSNSDRSKI